MGSYRMICLVLLILHYLYREQRSSFDNAAAYSKKLSFFATSI